MAKSEAISITILNWDKFNPRKDVKHSSWFRLEHSLFEDPELFDLSHSQLLFWIYLLTNASKKNGPTFILSLAHADRVGRFKKSDIDLALETLQNLGRIEISKISVTGTSRARHASVTSAYATNETNETNERDETGTDRSPGPGLSPQGLFEMWNTSCGPLPKAERFTGKRIASANAQLKLYPDPEHWAQVIGKFTASQFCVETWKPGFDAFLSESKRISALEGKYDQRSTQGPAAGAEDTWEQAANQVLVALKKYPNWLDDETLVRSFLGDELFNIARKANTTELRRVPPGPFHLKNVIMRLKDARGVIDASGGGP